MGFIHARLVGQKVRAVRPIDAGFCAVVQPGEVGEVTHACESALWVAFGQTEACWTDGERALAHGDLTLAGEK